MKAGVVVAIGLSLAAVGCGRSDAKDETPKVEEKKVKVESAVVEEQRVPKPLDLTGVLSADKRTDWPATSPGSVIRTFVERGDHVKPGQLLAQLDSRAAVLTESEARA